jgi:hypothetical protein
MKDALNAWAHPLGFNLKLGRLVPSVEHGSWYYLQCSRQDHASGKKISAAENSVKERQSTSERCGCEYCIVGEETDAGWVPLKYKDAHNHPCTTGPERLADAGIRTHALKDDDLCSFGRLLFESGVGMKATCKAMKKYAQSRGLDSNFTVKDARNKIGETAKEKALDATNAVKELLRLRDEEGVHVHFETDEDARLNTVFFEMPGAAAKFARGASISGSQRVHVILYDTTFNTNRKGLKLGFISSVDEHRRTYILATTMVMNEDHESFEWCLAELKKAFGVESTVIFTDSDPALAKAIAKELPHSKHYLCTFHLSLNLTTNCKAAFPRDERQKQDKKRRGLPRMRGGDSRVLGGVLSKIQTKLDKRRIQLSGLLSKVSWRHSVAAAVTPQLKRPWRGLTIYTHAGRDGRLHGLGGL